VLLVVGPKPSLSRNVREREGEEPH
jgi:hypothetical protein